MSKITFTDLSTATALVAYEMDEDGIMTYAEYVETNGVTVETVSGHVAALTTLAYPGGPKSLTTEGKYARKMFSNRVRNGLNRHFGAVSKAESKGASDKFATALALKCDDLDAAVAKFVSEWQAANLTDVDTRDLSAVA